MAYSGRCLLSGYINKRDPNQGTCTNSCRWEYKVHEGKEDDVGQIVHRQEPIAVQRWIRPWGRQAERRPGAAGGVQLPGEFATAFEDEHGTYIMNSRTCAPSSTWSA